MLSGEPGSCSRTAGGSLGCSGMLSARARRAVGALLTECAPEQGVRTVTVERSDRYMREAGAADPLERMISTLRMGDGVDTGVANGIEAAVQRWRSLP